MTSPATAPGAERVRELWSVGDYQRVGVRLVPASEQLVADLQVRPGERLLDIGGGTGNTALAAARRDADVLCTDVVPALLEHARRRADLEGLQFDTDVADAQALPYEDGSFDVVTSTLGVVFVADAERAAAELLRVLRPGGRFGLTSWVPEAPGGKLLELIRRHDPGDHPGDLLRWGTRAGVDQLLGRRGVQLRYTERTVDFTAPSVEVQWQRYVDWYAPVRVAWERLDEPGRQAFHDEFVDMWGSYSRGSPGVLVPNTYLQVIGVRS
ncbi:methyltransferase domain-containing protein [Geodermatophilus sp. SYSU D00815]